MASPNREDLVLKCIDGKYKGRFIYVNPNSEGEKFGSGNPEVDGLTISIENVGLDTRHAKIEYSNGHYYLTDLGSSSGTWIKIPQDPEVSEVLDLGKIIKLGNIDLEVTEGKEVNLSDNWADMFKHEYLLLKSIGEFTLDDFLNINIQVLDMSKENKQDLGNAQKSLIKWPKKLRSVRLSSNMLTIEIGWKPVIIGSSSECDVVIPTLDDQLVKIYYEDNKYWMTNLSEKASSAFRKLKEGEKYLIRPGINFKIGEVEFSTSRFNVGYWSEVGLRPTMEDAHQIIDNLFIDNEKTLSYYAVYDGHGGSICSEFLKNNLHKIIKKKIKNYEIEHWPRQIARSCIECDQLFYETYKAQANSVGSTAVISIILGNRIIVCNIGDSRAVLSRNGAPIQLSRDHKPTLPDESKRIEENGGNVIFGRVQGKLAVSRAFGDFEFKENQCLEDEELIGELVIAEPEIEIVEINKEIDEFIVLGCDGLFEAFSNDDLISQIRQKIRKMFPFEQDPQFIIKDIVKQAVTDGLTSDNVSAILILLSGGIQ
ncbi:unnamed protein product [Blepharisma stoltei]|uniref:Protein phosphatase 2C n=1 Tax=Blepharisma stoltei TaxID=1481888 RepID=A0AAU9I732_9CILI|nr:unnamed protein product [Blepharisma stoltei]